MWREQHVSIECRALRRPRLRDARQPRRAHSLNTASGGAEIGSPSISTPKRADRLATILRGEYFLARTVEPDGDLVSVAIAAALAIASKAEMPTTGRLTRKGEPLNRRQADAQAGERPGAKTHGEERHVVEGRGRTRRARRPDRPGVSSRAGGRSSPVRDDDRRAVAPDGDAAASRSRCRARE